MSLPIQQPESTTKDTIKTPAKDEREKMNQIAEKSAERAGKTEHAYDSQNDIFTK